MTSTSTNSSLEASSVQVRISSSSKHFSSRSQQLKDETVPLKARIYFHLLQDNLHFPKAFLGQVSFTMNEVLSVLTSWGIHALVVVFWGHHIQHLFFIMFSMHHEMKRMWSRLGYFYNLENTKWNPTNLLLPEKFTSPSNILIHPLLMFRVGYFFLLFGVLRVNCFSKESMNELWMISGSQCLVLRRDR